MRIYYSAKFEREYRRLPLEIKLLAEEKEKMFRNDPFDPRLHTHKLHGGLKDYWAFQLDQRHRVIFGFAKERVVWFHAVGDHSIYKWSIEFK